MEWRKYAPRVQEVADPVDVVGLARGVCAPTNKEFEAHTALGVLPALAVFRAARRCEPDSFMLARDYSFDGAAILPVMQPPGGVGVFFLLGLQEMRAVAKRQGGRWTSFGGHAARGEPDSCCTAAREFCEETMGLVRWREGQALPVRNWEPLAESLRSGNFLSCMRLVYVSRGRPRRYDVFLLKIPWDASISSRFRAARRSFRAERGREWMAARRGGNPSLDDRGRLRPSCAELAGCAVWSVEQIRQMVRGGCRVLADHLGNVRRCRRSLVPVMSNVLQQLAEARHPSVIDRDFPDELYRYEETSASHERAERAESRADRAEPGEEPHVKGDPHHVPRRDGTAVPAVGGAGPGHQPAAGAVPAAPGRDDGARTGAGQAP